MARLAAAVLAVLALAAPAQAAHRSDAGVTGLRAPSNLRAFLLRADESPAQVFSRTPSFAWNAVRGAKRYLFVLASSPSFAWIAFVLDDAALTSPAASSGWPWSRTPSRPPW